ncbi:FRAS1-related extracelluar matrix protein 1/2 [Sarotherodon galilaeus]
MSQRSNANKGNGDNQSECVRSRSSRSSGTSSGSKISIAIAMAKAKAEAAQARAAHSKREIELKVEQARIQASLDALIDEKEKDAAVAEVNSLVAGLQDMGLEVRSEADSLVSQSIKDQRVAAFVSEQASLCNKGLSATGDNLPPPRPVTHPHNAGQTQAAASAAIMPHHALQAPRKGEAPLPQGFKSPFYPPPTPQFSGTLPQQNPRQDFTSPAHQPVHGTLYRGDHDHSTTTGDLIKYLARNHLVTSGLTTYDDQPINYWAWKTSFQNAISNLDLSAAEELDLLTKHLGKESAEQVRRIRAVNIRNPTTGLYTAWGRLDEVYGSPEAVEQALFSKLESFPKLTTKDPQRLRDLADLLSELQAAKEDGYLAGLSYLNTSRGIKPIIEKLPYNIQEKWLYHGTRYKQEHFVSFPPFSVLVNFICTEAKARTDPSFNLFMQAPAERRNKWERPTKTSVHVHKTQVSGTAKSESKESRERIDPNKHCPLHKRPHPLRKCRGFREKSLDDRKQLLKEHYVCFRCCSSTEHLAKNCTAEITCTECGSTAHVTALHPHPPTWKPKSFPSTSEDSGEEDRADNQEVKSTCTQVCGEGLSARACAKICLVRVFPNGRRGESKRMYAILDEQSNRSLARSEFFEAFKISGRSYSYTLKTCAGRTETSGRRASGYTVEPLDEKLSISLPTLLECNQIPNVRAEIPTPDAAYHHAHLKRIADKIPPPDPDAKILLLLGRDILRVHKVREQISGPGDAPFAQRLDLGWVIVGDVCLGGAHRPPEVRSYKTAVLGNGRTSHLQPCNNQIKVTEVFGRARDYQHHPALTSTMLIGDNLGQTVFARTPNDHKLAPSMEDLEFLRIMEAECCQDNSNSWVAPLPFRSPRRRLPNNRKQVLERLVSLRRSLEKRPRMKADFLEFMEKMLKKAHAEVAPPMQPGQECWYLPLFGVYHPRKPDKIRVVFDSSASYEGVSLNDVLLTGPDLNNSLLGVLMRFRKEQVAITADIEHMFHCFIVKEDHRDFLRFLWYRDNDPTSDIVDYRMRVHLFGNSPSPAVAVYGLRRAAKAAEADYGSDARRFIDRDFYVDDALKSFSTEEEGIAVLQRAQKMLAASNLRLHKIASNRSAVIRAFPPQDHSQDFNGLDLFIDDLPIQRSLGLFWNMRTDTFTFQIEIDQKPFTRRGVLSTVNSLYDPLGFLAPITVDGRRILRELTLQAEDWDAPLPKDMEIEWTRWKQSLQDLEGLQIPRPYTSLSTTGALRRELCVFADASVKAIAAVAYIRVTSKQGQTEIGFVFGKAKLAPQPGLTIPRLELCAAVLAVEIAEMIVAEMDTTFDNITYYTDSKVVLGYIHNQSRRFYVYVHNRVQRILQSPCPGQWKYVPTHLNPADVGSRTVASALLSSTPWLKGPAFLCDASGHPSELQETYNLVDPDIDAEVRPQVTTRLTHVAKGVVRPQRFERFSKFSTLRVAIAHLIHVARSFARSIQNECRGWHICCPTEEELLKAEVCIVKSVQGECYAEELKCINSGTNIPSSSSLWRLHPIVDQDRLLRVGGRIEQSGLGMNETHPIIIPGRHHLATLLVSHYHEAVKHQGRHLTEGAIRAAGFWLVGAKRCISSLLYRCITCRKLRGKAEHQQMAALPAERLQVAPPFTYVGVDVFGPWDVVSRRTRGGVSNSKRWAVMFSCMCSRAVHIEVIEAMSASSFINALRRFFAVRGPAKQIRSDCGTNFVGASRELEMDKINPGFDSVEKYLNKQSCTWVFNPPHASHMGGAWERMIGIARRILDCMLLEQRKSRLTHEVLTTLMAEVAAIMNARPIIPVSSDPESPCILTPAMLLTLKTGPTPPLPSGKFEEADLFREEWKQVQGLADMFWNRWRREYLKTLQLRHKWQGKQPSLQEGDIVLLKDNQAERNEWPMGIITKTFPGKDGLVRKVEVEVVKDGDRRGFSRPITEVVLLLSPKSDSAN